MRATIKHELGHAVVGDVLGLGFQGILLDNRLADETEFPELAAMNVCMLGGSTHFGPWWHSDDATHTMALPGKADAVACTAVAGVVCELTLSGRGVDVETFLPIMRQYRNTHDVTIFSKAVKAQLTGELAAPYVARARAIIDNQREAILRAVEQVAQHVCDVDAGPGLGLPLPYEIPRTVYPDGLGRDGYRRGGVADAAP